MNCTVCSTQVTPDRYTIDINTRETMTKVQQHLSVPENRLRYAFDFLLNHGPDFVDYSKCYNAIAEWSDKLDTSEAHY